VVEVDLVTADAEMIPDPVASGLGGIKQGVDFGLTQKILPPLVGVGRGCATFYISPVGR
jgi:hypothetical protein